MPLSGNKRDRLFDWTMAGAMVGLAVMIRIWPGTIESSAFRYLSLVLSSGNVGVFLFLGGLARGVALWANGRSIWCGPILRSGGALVGCLIWALMASSLFVLHKVTGSTPSPGIPVYTMLCVGELACFYRAVRGLGCPNY